MYLSDLTPGQMFMFKDGAYIYKVGEPLRTLGAAGRVYVLTWKWRGFFHWPFTYKVWIRNMSKGNYLYAYSFNKVTVI